MKRFKPTRGYRVSHGATVRGLFVWRAFFSLN